MKFTLHDNPTPIADRRGVLNKLFHSEPQLVLSPVPETEAEAGDELLDSIAKAQQEDTITLEEVADPDRLDAYWTSVHDDLERDPEWFKFAED